MKHHFALAAALLAALVTSCINYCPAYPVFDASGYPTGDVIAAFQSAASPKILQLVRRDGARVQEFSPVAFGDLEWVREEGFYTLSCLESVTTFSGITKPVVVRATVNRSLTKVKALYAFPAHPEKPGYLEGVDPTLAKNYNMFHSPSEEESRKEFIENLMNSLK